MEKTRKERENIYRNRLMSSNDHVRHWHLRGKHIKGNISEQDGQRLEEGKKELKISPVKPTEPLKTLKPEKEKAEEENSRIKSSKKDLIYLDLKPLIKPKTAREAIEARMKIKRFRKPSDRVKKKESGTDVKQENAFPHKKLPSFHNTWEHTNYSIVPTCNVNRGKEGTGRERKKKNPDRVKKRNKSVHRLESDLENPKNMELILGDKKNKKLEVLYPSFNDFVSDGRKYMDETGGEAVVIFHRQNRNKYLQPQTGDGYQFEQIAFSGSCETTVDLVQSKRSLSEPRRNSTKEFYVARRRTRFQLEPHKRPSTQSDFHSAMDFFRQSSGSVEFKKFEEINDSVTRIFYEPIGKCEKFEMKKYMTKPLLKKSKSNTDGAISGVRLQQTAEKKLDLYKEMIRAEKVNKKKFWESIERSLNYRCAVAEMFSSQSYLSSNESSKFFSSTENQTGRSTNIYVRESVIEKISSYQGFSRYVTSDKATSRNKSKPRNSSQTSNSAYCHMKTVLDTFLIKEDEEENEELMAKHNLEEGFTSQSSIDTLAQTDETPYDFNNSFFSQTTTNKLTLIESSLKLSDVDSELEILMAKLSEEIRKCTTYMEIFNESAQKKDLPKLSASDSTIEFNKKKKKKATKKNSNLFKWPSIENRQLPVFVYSATGAPQRKSRKYKSEESLKKKMGDSSLISATNNLDPDFHPRFFEDKNREETDSNRSILSFPNQSYNKSNTDTRSTKTFRNAMKQYSCCDDCKVLKRRIIKLEKNLEQIQRRMPFYPSEYQDSIKNCLENLNVTSETFLKRLRSCAKLKYVDTKCRPKSRQCSKRSTSAPGPIVHELSKRKLSLRPSNSDYHLDVGMEITMENVDPVTGQKLYPEANRDILQEGNIQCRMFKDGEKPFLVMDTDFSYNPETGMLFKQKTGSVSRFQSADFLVPVKSNIKKAPSALDLIDTSTQAYPCTPIASQPFQVKSPPSKVLDKSQKDLLVPENVYKKRNDPHLKENINLAQDKMNVEDQACMKYEISAPETMFNVRRVESKKSKSKEKSTQVEKKYSLENSDVMESYSERSENRPSSRETKKKSKIIWFGRKKSGKTIMSYSRIPIRRKATPSYCHSRVDSASNKSSLTSIHPRSECYRSPSVASKISFKLAKLFSFTWTFGVLLCKLVHYMQSVSAICSVLTLTAMSLERYYAIVHPMKAQYICTISQARRIITATWISAFLLAIPILFAQVHLKVGVKVEAYWCVRDWDNKAIWRAHELYMMLLILVVPTGVMAVAYTAICWEIWEVMQRRQDMTSGKGNPRLKRNPSNDSFSSSAHTNNVRLDSKRRVKTLLKPKFADDGASVKQVIKMLVAVVVIYVICWGPMLIDNVLQAYGTLSHIRIGWLKYMGTVFHLMAYFNSCINPIIYGFMSKNFRESFRKTLCCVGKKPKTAYRSFSLSQTRNTSIRYAESSFGRTISIALPV